MAKTRKAKKAKAQEKSDDGFPGGLPEVEASPQPFAQYIEAAGEISGWKSANEVLDSIESVRTVFPDFNRAVRVGGLPIQRIHTIHGPTHGGKTAFVLGLVKSFADRGFLSGYVDAEHALGRTFAREMTADLEQLPNFLAVRPSTYEETIARADAFLNKAIEVREKYPEHCSILVIDSINKLVPKRELEKLLKQGEIDEKGAGELAKGHHGRYRAALNQAWLDHLTPKVARAGCALVIIAQERDDSDPTDFFKTFKVKGGAALLFDASLVIRVMKGQPVYLPGGASKSGAEKNEAICGFSHRVRIWKSKVGHMDGRHSDCLFHLSNGKLIPQGLDTARDALMVGDALGLVSKAGSWYTFGRRRLQGEPKAIQYLSANPEKLFELLDGIAKRLDQNEGRL